MQDNPIDVYLMITPKYKSYGCYIAKWVLFTGERLSDRGRVAPLFNRMNGMIESHNVVQTISFGHRPNH